MKTLLLALIASAALSTSALAQSSDTTGTGTGTDGDHGFHTAPARAPRHRYHDTAPRAPARHRRGSTSGAAAGKPDAEPEHLWRQRRIAAIWRRFRQSGHERLHERLDELRQPRAHGRPGLIRLLSLPADGHGRHGNGRHGHGRNGHGRHGHGWHGHGRHDGVGWHPHMGMAGLWPRSWLWRSAGYGYGRTTRPTGITRTASSTAAATAAPMTMTVTGAMTARASMTMTGQRPELRQPRPEL